MKKSMLVLLCVALGMFLVSSAVAIEYTPGMGIKKSPHDLSSQGAGGFWNAGLIADPVLDRICIYCHAPHNTATSADLSVAGLTYAPLWNRPASTHTASYKVYQNTLDGSPYVPNNESHALNATPGQPGGVSKLCLSCHDGTVAVNQYGTFPNSGSKYVGTMKMGSQPRYVIGGGTAELSNHHPIGFAYGEALSVDDEIWTTDKVLLGNNPSGLSVGDLLFDGKVECASCHDVHNTKNKGSKLTWVSDTQSNLCLSCHNK